jgi:hypothetical protein
VIGGASALVVILHEMIVLRPLSGAGAGSVDALVRLAARAFSALPNLIEQIRPKQLGDHVDMVGHQYPFGPKD